MTRESSSAKPVCRPAGRVAPADRSNRVGTEALVQVLEICREFRAQALCGRDSTFSEFPSSLGHTADGGALVFCPLCWPPPRAWVPALGAEGLQRRTAEPAPRGNVFTGCEVVQVTWQGFGFRGWVYGWLHLFLQQPCSFA